MTILYKIDSKNNLRSWGVKTEGAILYQEAGLVDGAKVPHKRTAKGKNIGRSNETTPEEQAILEMTALIAKKKDEFYQEVPDFIAFGSPEDLRKFLNANKLSVPDPMLAKTYDPKHLSDEGYLASAKLDGMRCAAVIPPIGSPITLWSRGGKEILTMDHIKVELRMLQDSGFVGTLDGELYVHSSEDNFQEVMKSVKKFREDMSPLVEYHVYELYDSVKTAIERYTLLSFLLKRPELVRVVKHPQTYLTSPDQIKEIHALFIGEGFEGTMIKNVKSLYREGARSSDLLKFKDFEDEEFTIIDVIPSDKRPTQGIFVMSKDGITFNANPKMTHIEREAVLTNKADYIGKQGTVTFFGKSEDGVPRFPVFKAVRDTADVS